MKRASYQSGSLLLKPRKRGPAMWIFRYYDESGARKAEPLGTIERYPTKAAAQKEANRFRDEINDRLAGISMAGLCDRFEREPTDTRSHSMDTYTGFAKRVRAEFGTRRVVDVGRDVPGVEAWINNLESLPTLDRTSARGEDIKGRPSRPLSKKTKLHYKAFLHLLFEHAMKWNLFPMQRNPMSLIKVRGKRVRVRTITLLTSEQYHRLIADPDLRPHVRTMIHIALLLGLRISEILGLRWEDVDFAARTLTVRQSSVGQHVDDTKTPSSYAELPLHEELAIILQAWKEEEPPVKGWVFGNLLTGRPYWQGTLQQDHLVPAGKKIGIARLGWHDFRHTYRAMMGALEIPLETQKTLMRHADISTTLSYGTKTPAERSRPANAQVVEILRRKA